MEDFGEQKVKFMKTLLSLELIAEILYKKDHQEMLNKTRKTSYVALFSVRDESLRR